MKKLSLASLLVLVALVMTACGGRRREWSEADNSTACPSGGTGYSYYFADSPEGSGYDRFESPEAAAEAARADGCEISTTLPASVVACCH